MVEGASGFGTPIPLAAPMLVSMGHPAFESVVVLLIFNTVATVWGAVGTLDTALLSSVNCTREEEDCPQPTRVYFLVSSPYFYVMHSQERRFGLV
jgi:hypothetical protein